MFKSVGLDIVETERVEKLLKAHGDRFISKILGVNEIEIYNRRTDKKQFLAGRFAAKEAIIKGLGVYLDEKPSFSTIEILNDESGRPQFDSSILVNEKSRCHLSISHEKKYAAAVCGFYGGINESGRNSKSVQRVKSIVKRSF